MRLPLLLLFTVLGILRVGAQSADGGIDFVEKPFEELLAEARAEDKLVFVDAYAVWCGPCKLMAKKVFTQERVGDVYNERYVNAKIDMEKGEGPALARRYNVMAYPTYLFIDGNGDIVHKALGYIPADQFLEVAEIASSGNNLGALNARYDAGERDPEFLESYLATLGELYEKTRADEVLDQYLNSKTDWNDPATVKLIVGNPGEVGGDRMHFLLTHPDEAVDAAGSGTYMMGLQQVLLTQYMRTAGKRQLPHATEIGPFYLKYAAPLKDRLTAHYAMFQAEQMRDMNAYLPAARAYYQAYPSNDFAELNSAAWIFFENSEDPAELETALGWAQKSVDLNPTYPNLDTLAWLYKKTGNDEMAKQTARQAIEYAKRTEQDYSDTAKLLEDGE